MNPQLTDNSPPFHYVGRDVDALGLDNGLSVQLVRDPSREQIGVTLEIEAPFERQHAHLFSRSRYVAYAIQLGSIEFEGPDNFAKFFESRGANFQVRFSAQSTRFGYKITKEDLSESFRRLAGAISMPEFPSDLGARLRKSMAQLNRDGVTSWEQQVVKEEQRLYGMPDRDPYHDELGKSGLAFRLIHYILRYYTPENMTLVVTHNDAVDREELVEMIEEEFQRTAVFRKSAMDHYGPHFERKRGGPNAFHPPSEGAVVPSWSTFEDSAVATDPVTREKFRVSRVNVESDDTVLCVVFPKPTHSYCGKVYWDYLLTSSGDGSLARVLKSWDYVKLVRPGSHLWTAGKENEQQTVEIHLTPSGRPHIARVLALVFHYIAVITARGPLPSVWRDALQFRQARDLRLLAEAGEDPFVWSDILANFVDRRGRWYDRAYDEAQIAREGAYLRKDWCHAIVVSEFGYLCEKPSSLYFNHDEEFLTLHPSEDELRIPRRPFALPLALDLATAGLDNAKGGPPEFVELSKAPLVAQYWHAATPSLTMKLKLPLVVTGVRVAARMLVAYLNRRFRQHFDPALFTGTAKLAEGELDVALTCVPDAAAAVLQALLAMLEPQMRDEETQRIFNAAKRELGRRLVQRVEAGEFPRFTMEIETVLGVRNMMLERADLVDVRLDTLPRLAEKDFVMLLWGNVHRRQSEELAALLAAHLGVKLRSDAYAKPPTVWLSTRRGTRAGFHMLPGMYQKCVSMHAYCLGEYTPAGLVQAEALASVVAKVMLPVRRLGDFSTPRHKAYAVRARGHTWLVVETAGPQCRGAYRAMQELLQVRAAEALEALDEKEMAALRARTHDALLRPRENMADEAERVWHPMFWAGRPYTDEAAVLEATGAEELNELFKERIIKYRSNVVLSVSYGSDQRALLNFKS